MFTLWIEKHLIEFNTLKRHGDYFKTNENTEICRHFIDFCKQNKQFKSDANGTFWRFSL